MTVVVESKTRLYTVAEAAEEWGVSTATLYREIKSGNLRAKKRRGTKKGYRLTAELMEEWIEKGLEFA